MIFRLFLLLCLLSVNGCEYLQKLYDLDRPVVSSVTAFSNLVVPVEGTKIHLVTYPEDKNQSLEWLSYKTKIEEHLSVFGYTVGTVENADHIGFVLYGIGDGVTTQHTYSSPIYGWVGGGTTQHSGTINTGGNFDTFSGTSTQDSSYEVVGVSTNSVSVTRFERHIIIDIFDKQSLIDENPRKLYEGKVDSVGTCGQLVEVFDEMIEGLFAKFPSGSGRVEVVSETNC